MGILSNEGLSSDIKGLRAIIKPAGTMSPLHLAANAVPRYFALVPAAGAGARMGEAIPKQYLLLAGEPLINHALRTLASDPRIERVFVVLAPTDSRFDDAS